MEKTTSFAVRLRALLDSIGWTQAELARKANISKSSITRYLKGDWEAKQDAVYAIAHATSVNEAWLMGYDVPMRRSSEAASFEPMPELKTIRKFAEKLFLSYGMTSEQLAEATDVPAKKIESLFSGSPVSFSEAEANRIADVLHCLPELLSDPKGFSRGNDNPGEDIAALRGLTEQKGYFFYARFGRYPNYMERTIFLGGRQGFYQLSKEQLDELIEMISSYAEFVCANLEKKLSAEGKAVTFETDSSEEKP